MNEEASVEEKVEEESAAMSENESTSDATPQAEAEPSTPEDEPTPDTASETEEAPPTEDDGSKKKTPSESIKGAWKQVFGQALNVALQGRGNVVMARVNDEALKHLDMLVEAEITKSRSESAAFLINEGIYANQELFDRIGAIAQQISDLRTQLREQVQREIQNKQSSSKE